MYHCYEKYEETNILTTQYHPRYLWVEHLLQPKERTKLITSMHQIKRFPGPILGNSLQRSKKLVWENFESLLMIFFSALTEGLMVTLVQIRRGIKRSCFSH